MGKSVAASRVYFTRLSAALEVAALNLKLVATKGQLETTWPIRALEPTLCTKLHVE